MDTDPTTQSTFDASALRARSSWRLSVWGLRVAGLGLLIAVVGLVVHALSSAVGLTMLAVGVIIYLIAVLAIYGGLIPAMETMPTPRPSFWQLRRLLLHDAIHRRS